MIQNESMVVIIDNTGALKWKVIRVLKWHLGKSATIWDKVVLAIKQSKPDASVKSWDVAKWVVVRTVKEIRRKDGSLIRFWDNAVVLIKPDWAPVWKRIFWPIAREVKEKWFFQVAKLAEEVI
jgi:large subunit ribosomal protein L14